MAKACRMHPQTVERALKTLVSLRIISKEVRPGQTSIYRPLPPSSWLTANHTENNGWVLKSGRPKIMGGTSPKQIAGTHPKVIPTKCLPEGSPIKAIQSAVEIPVSLSTDEFKASWAEWLEYRRLKKKRVSPPAAKKQLATLAAMGTARAIAAINHSIANDWQGIFEPKHATATDHRAEKAAKEYPEEIPIPFMPIKR
jgi:hypothetical protein